MEKLILGLILSGMVAEAAPSYVKGSRCTVNTYSTTADVATGGFDDDSFTDQTRKVLLNELRAKGFKIPTSRKDPEFYRAEFMVELKLKSGNVSLKIYGPTELGEAEAVFSLSLPGGSDVNGQALKLIQSLPVCMRH